jgi:hypothetical protein
VVTMKNAILWDVAPCRSCVNRRFGGMYRFYLQGRKIGERGTSVSCSHLLTLVPCEFFYPEEGGDTFLWNVSSNKIYTVPHPRRRHSSNIILIDIYLGCKVICLSISECLSVGIPHGLKVRLHILLFNDDLISIANQVLFCTINKTK